MVEGEERDLQRIRLGTERALLGGGAGGGKEQGLAEGWRRGR